MTRLELCVWPGAGSLPSCDPACAAAISLLDAAIPGQYVLTNASFLLSGTVPSLTTPTATHHGLSCIIHYLRTFHSLDAHLFPSQRADSEAMLAYIDEALRPLVDYTIFACEKNWTNIFRHGYAAACVWPTNVFVPDSIRRNALQVLKEMGFPMLPDLQKVPQNEHTVKFKLQQNPLLYSLSKQSLKRCFQSQLLLQKARHVFTTLQQYVRSRPSDSSSSSLRTSSADAVVSAYLRILLNPKLEEDVFGTLLIGEFPALVGYVRTHQQVVPSTS